MFKGGVCGSSADECTRVRIFDDGAVKTVLGQPGQVKNTETSCRAVEYRSGPSFRLVCLAWLCSSIAYGPCLVYSPTFFFFIFLFFLSNSVPDDVAAVVDLLKREEMGRWWSVVDQKVYDTSFSPLCSKVYSIEKRLEQVRLRNYFFFFSWATSSSLWCCNAMRPPRPLDELGVGVGVLAFCRRSNTNVNMNCPDAA